MTETPEDIVSMRELAAELGLGLPMARLVARELSAYLMIRPGRQQCEARQLSACWTRKQADQILEERERRGYRIGPKPTKPPDSVRRSIERLETRLAWLAEETRKAELRLAKLR